MKLIIHGRLPGLNEYTRECRGNRYAGAEMKREAEDLIRYCIRRQLEPIEGRVFLNITWYEPNKKRDMDNIAFAKKFIQDSLVKEGIIKNDGWAGIAGLSDNFQVDKENPRIEVEIVKEQ